MEAHQRAAIEGCKQEKAKHMQLLAELQAQKNGIPATSAHQQQQEGLQLQRLANTYRHKAHEEQQLLEHIEQELHKAKQQIEHQRKQHSVPGTAAQQGIPAAKCCIALQERLSHKKQQLDEGVSRNKALGSAVEDLSKQGTAAQQLHLKLKRQLTDVTSELAQLQQLVGATEQAQQQAAALAEQMRLHDDAENLALSEALKQLQGWTLTQQQRHGVSKGHPAPPPEALHEENQRCGAHRACGTAEEEAIAILEQLVRTCDAAGLVTSCPASSATEEAHGRNWATLLQRVQQLQAGNVGQFRQCMLMNHQMQSQEVRHAPQG